LCVSVNDFAIQLATQPENQGYIENVEPKYAPIGSVQEELLSMSQTNKKAEQSQEAMLIVLILINMEQICYLFWSNNLLRNIV